MTSTVTIRTVTARDRIIHAYVAEHPGCTRRDIAADLDMSSDTIGHRLQRFVGSGYLVRRGTQWVATYHPGEPLPEPKSQPRTTVTCPDCAGQWEQPAGGPTVCGACVNVRDTLAYARELGITGLRVVHKPLATRLRAPHPTDYTARVWVEIPQDLDFMAVDAGKYLRESELQAYSEALAA